MLNIILFFQEKLKLLDKETATSLFINWSKKLKEEQQIHFAGQARRIGMNISTFNAIRFGHSSISTETIVSALHKLANTYPDLHELADAAGIDVDDIEYTEDEVIAALRDRIDALERENRALLKELSRKGGKRKGRG